MLAALEKGVKGTKWFSLNDKVSRVGTLELAWEQVRRKGGSAGIDAISVKRFAKTAQEELTRLSGCGSPKRGAEKSGRWAYRR